jgi:hypothetical protein
LLGGRAKEHQPHNAELNGVKVTFYNEVRYAQPHNKTLKQIFFLIFKPSAQKAVTLKIKKNLINSALAT